MRHHRVIRTSAAGLALAASATLAGAAGPTPPAVPHRDLQCLMVMSKLSQGTDQQAQVAGTMGVLYFAGKVFGANPSVDIGAALQTEAAQAKGTDMDALVRECGTEMQSRGQQLETAGKALTAKGL